MADAAVKEETAKPTLAELKRMLDDARDTAPAEGRKDAELSRDYYNGKQLDAVIIGGMSLRAVLAKRDMPEIVFNRIKPAINGTLGVVGKNKTDPRAYMRNPPKEQQPGPQAGMMGQASQMPMGAQAPPQPNLDAGDVASMTLRYIADSTEFPTLKMDVLENILIEGTGAVIIEIDEDKDVVVSQVRWNEFFYDPRSRKYDFGDARYMGIAKWRYADDVAAIYPKSKRDIEQAIENGDASTASSDETWKDKPDDQKAWVDKKLRRLMVVELYYKRDGEWLKCVFHSGGILEDAAPVGYKDAKGRTECPIEAQSGYIDEKNNRYGMVRDLRPVQDEANMRRIKSIHEMNSRQVQQVDPNAPPIDVDEARREAAKPDGVLPAGWQIVPRQDVVANNIEMLQLSISEIERMGPNPAIIGRMNASASGRADQIKQDAGLTELWPLLGRFSGFETRCYKKMWNRAAQFWDAPKWIRVADDEGAPTYVQINEPAPIDPVSQMPMGEPKHHIAKMDVDIVVDQVPDTATLEQEIFTEFLQLASAYVGTPQQVSFKTLVEMSPLPKKREIIKKLEADQAATAAAVAPQQMLDTEQKAADVGKTKAETHLTEVKGVVEAMRGHMEASAANVLPPGHEAVANLPQNQPQPPSGA